MNKLKEFVKLVLIDPLFIIKIIKIILNRSKQKFVIIGTPGHGNIGDHAIALNELIYLKDNFPDKKVFEITTPFYNVCAAILSYIISEKDIVFITGGGWMGDLWIHDEMIIRDIVNRFKENTIIVFPQTLYYTNTENGKQVLKDTVEIFARHKKLYLFVRENNSLTLAIRQFKFTGKSKVLFCPDMVLYGALGEYKKTLVKNDLIMLCIRNDVEQVIDPDLLYGCKKYGNMRCFSTVIGHIVPLFLRRYYIKLLLGELSQAKMVITDRLHAMILSVMMGIPCIVMNNKTGKVFGVATYLKKYYPIIMAESIEDVDEIIKTNAFYSGNIEIEQLKKQYNVLTEVIKGVSKNGCD